MADQIGPGRPSKLTDAFLAAAKDVLSAGDDVIICTDEELLMLINEKLPEADQITQRTFEAWKKLAQESEDLDENFVQFLRVIKRALIREKKSLYQKLREDEKAWQRWAWIIERKFDEWNIKRKVESDVRFKKDGAAALANALLGNDDEADLDPS